MGGKHEQVLEENTETVIKILGNWAEKMNLNWQTYKSRDVGGVALHGSKQREVLE